MADAEVIVVLGAAVRADGTPSAALIRRAQHAARLFLAGEGAYVVVSGGRTRAQCAGGLPPCSESRAMREVLVAAGVPADRIVEEDRSTRTLENATCVRALMDREGWERVLLVTDDYHLPRALMTFRAAGIRCRGKASRGAWRDEGVAAACAILLRELIAIVSYAILIARGRLDRA